MIKVNKKLALALSILFIVFTFLTISFANNIIVVNKKNVCPSIPQQTNDWMVNLTAFPSMTELRQKLHTIHEWGHWRGPDNCIAQQKVAIIIPYRNRFLHLRALLNNLHRFLQLQQLEYQIFVINQFSTGKKADKFNRGKLLNVGFVEVQKQFCKSGEHCWDCVVFHDVDFVPENIENIYRCDQNSPKRLISATDEWDNYKYEPGDKAWLGGVVAIAPDQFALINGFSNNYWGWGAEDQNLRERFKLANKSVIFVRGALGHYKSVELVHKVNDTTNPEVDCGCRKVLINDLAKSWKIDGLTNLNYAHLSTTDEILFTNITVDLLMEESIKKGHPCGNKINGFYDCKNGEIIHHN